MQLQLAGTLDTGCDIGTGMSSTRGFHSSGGCSAFVQSISLCKPYLSSTLKTAVAHFRNATARETPFRLLFPQFV